jgi:hypothetical protein
MMTLTCNILVVWLTFYSQILGQGKRPTNSSKEQTPVVQTKPNKRPEKQEKDEDDDDEAFEDDYFEDTADQNNAGGADISSNKTTPSIFHCIIGGYGINGPMPTM